MIIVAELMVCVLYRKLYYIWLLVVSRPYPDDIHTRFYQGKWYGLSLRVPAAPGWRKVYYINEMSRQYFPDNTHC